MRKIIHYIHVHKAKGKWTVHSSKGCFHFDQVEIKVPSETVYQPNKKDNPRFFIKCKGILVHQGDYASII